MKKIFSWIIVVLGGTGLLLALVIQNTATALSPTQLSEYAQAGAPFYDPDSCKSSPGNFKFGGKELSWEDLNPLSGNDRLKLVVETYGEYAMQLQKYYGIPWEMPFAVMVFESQVGADHTADSVAYKVQEAGYFNIMGLTDGYKVDHYKDPNYAGYYVEKTKLTFAGYDTISDMLLGYFIYHGRNGINPDSAYDKGLKMLEPDNYRLAEAIPAFMYSYCPGGCYQDEIMALIRTGSKSWSGLLDVVQEKGWKNSEELAKEWNIQPGGIATERWGWGDIREDIWEAYGASGLPDEALTEIGSISRLSDSGSVQATVGNAVLHSPTNDWLNNAGLEGYIKNEIDTSGANGRHIDTSAVGGDGTYLSYAADAGNGSGLPGFIVLHLTSADNFGSRNWTNYCGGGNQNFYCPPHFTIDVKKREIFQHFPLSHPSAALSAQDGVSWDKYGIQIEIVGHGGTPDKTCISNACGSEYLYTNFSDEDWEYIAKLLIAISKETGIPLTSSVEWTSDYEEAKNLRLSKDELQSYIGVLGHTHVNGKWDPLSAWNYVEKALERMGYSYSPNTSNSGYCSSDFSIDGSCYKLSASEGGCTEDGFTYYWQGNGSPWNSISTPPCGTIADCGCGYASTAMVLTNFTGKKITPEDTYRLALKRHSKAFMTDHGTDPGVVPSIIEESGLGLNVESHSDNSYFTEDNISNLLRQGKMIVLTVGAETGDDTFTGGGHWIVIRGITSDGKWKIFSSSPRPNSEVNDTPFDPEIIIKTHVNHREYWYVVSR